MERRSYIKTVGSAAAVTVAAGCTGDSGESQDEDSAAPQEGDWPPPRSLVDVILRSDPGTFQDTLPRIWMNAAEEHYPDDVGVAYTTQTAGDGLVALNNLSDAEPHGGTIAGGIKVLTALVQQLTSDEATYELGGSNAITPICQIQADTRAIQINPDTTPIDDHFEWTWDDLVEYANEEGLTLGRSTTGGQKVLAAALQEWEPRFEEGAFEFVPQPGGSEARAAIARGDVDGYFGGYAGNIGGERVDFYKTQVAITDPERYQEFTDSMKEVEPYDDPDNKLTDEHIITNSEFPTEQAEKVVDMVMDNMFMWLPPGVPDEIYEIHREALQAAADDPATEEEVADVYDEHSYIPVFDESQIEDSINSKIELFTEDEEAMAILEENLID